MKKKANLAISAQNAVTDGVKFDRIIGTYAPGYLYGTVKTHKLSNPLRPIISQIPTPTYELAKQLNRLLSPYVPSHNTLKSSDEFLEVLRAHKPTGLIASLDVESLFTNVPVKETIDIIVNYALNNEHLPPPSKLSPALLKRMLHICTTDAPFRSPSGKLYLQTDGVAMGSPLGVLFANAYMCAVEDRVLPKLTHKPAFYKRYVDDICVLVENADALEDLRQLFEEHSVLKFTCEVEENRKLHFLDITLDGSDGTSFTTSVHRKTTNIGLCMNPRSACPERYKRGVVRTYVRRALTHCSTWELVHKEIEHIKQMLVDNGYTCQEIDNEVKICMDKHLQTSGNETTPADMALNKTKVHNVFYRNQFTDAYSEDEQVLKKIIKRNVVPKEGHDIKLLIYYKPVKSSSMVISNKEKTKMLKETNVVYKYKCKTGDCKLHDTASYIGHTRNTLSRRLTTHLHISGIAEHSRNVHGREITRTELDENTTILQRERNPRRLRILEAAYIYEYVPNMCDQQEHKGIITLNE